MSKARLDQMSNEGLIKLRADILVEIARRKTMLEGELPVEVAKPYEAVK